MVRYRIAQVGRGEGQVRRVAMAVQDLCGTDIGTGHVDLLLFIPRTASRFIRDLLSTVSLWWTVSVSPAKLCHAMLAPSSLGRDTTAKAERDKP